MTYTPASPDSPLTPFGVDLVVSKAAADTGMEVTRRPVVRVDDKLLPVEYMRRVPDYRLIRRLLLEGMQIPGASLENEVEYILRKRGQENE